MERLLGERNPPGITCTYDKYVYIGNKLIIAFTEYYYFLLFSAGQRNCKYAYTVILNSTIVHCSSLIKWLKVGFKFSFEIW